MSDENKENLSETSEIGDSIKEVSVGAFYMYNIICIRRMLHATCLLYRYLFINYIICVFRRHLGVLE